MKLYNSLSRQVEEFVPIQPGRVTMYVCGPTVYSTPHIGNARPAVVFDVLRRVLESDNTVVEFARNLTDIDDKIMDRAKEIGETIEQVTDRTIVEYHAIMRDLGVQVPTYEPRATGSIEPILRQIVALVTKGHAYYSEGHVLFDIASWAAHGKLSGHLQENLDAGHRVAVADYKKNPGDFVLWKPSSNDQPGWPSPWGRGRPGWHIECSAMIDDIFKGETIDIHAGGADLRFPHHECEISQFEAAHNHPLAKFWVHNGMLTVNGEKMAKSVGNIVTVNELLGMYHPSVIRLWMLGTHYRSSLDYTHESLQAAFQTLLGWHRVLMMIPKVRPFGIAPWSPVLDALKSDLNTPLAITRLNALIDMAAEGGETALSYAAMARISAEYLGIDLWDHDGFLCNSAEIGFRNEVEALIRQRQDARLEKNWAESDRLRTVLAELDVVVEDAKGSTFWYLRQG